MRLRGWKLEEIGPVRGQADPNYAPWNPPVSGAWPLPISAPACRPSSTGSAHSCATAAATIAAKLRKIVLFQKQPKKHSALGSVNDSGLLPTHCHFLLDHLGPPRAFAPNSRQRDDGTLLPLRR